MRRCRRGCDRFAYAGRMPLSNYLLQTVMGLLHLLRLGPRLLGPDDAAAEMLLAIALYRRRSSCRSAPGGSPAFATGRSNTVWRRLTYGRLAGDACRRRQRELPASSA